MFFSSSFTVSIIALFLSSSLSETDIKNFAKIISNTENFCNFVFGNHSEIL